VIRFEYFLQQFIKDCAREARELGEVGWGDVDWIGLAQDRNRWRGGMG
jgi:hypothetical protein